MNLLLILALYTLALCCQIQGCFCCSYQERVGLLEIKAACFNNVKNPPDPLKLHDWVGDKNSDCCGWERVKCSSTTHRVTHLSLSELFTFDYLNGSLFLPFQELRHLDLSENYPNNYGGIESLMTLKYLEDLNLGHNWFNESILWALGAYNLTKLRMLDLSHNRMLGPIPESILQLNNLETLSLHTNYMNGTLSGGFCMLRNLKVLNLGSNWFKGTLPMCLRKLTSLRKLDVSNNEFFGVLQPSLISNLLSLRHISFSNNQLDGARIFNSLANRKSQFDFLGFSDCRLNASAHHLLSVLYNQHSLRGIELSHNSLHGYFPNWLARNNTKLETLILRNNSLEGSIRFPRSRPTNLKLIDISANPVRGTIQSYIGHICPKLKALNMSKTNLEGRIPTSLQNMKHLKLLDLSNNRLDGHIPIGIFNSTNLNILQLSNNSLSGDIIPDARIQFNGILLDISNNKITGKIPISILGNELFMLVLGKNFFHGPIPPDLCRHVYVHLDLSENQLFGKIPSCLLKLQSLYLQHNNLTGPIPKASTYPIILELSHNNISGSIPYTMGFSKRMRVLRFRGNRLSGSIPHSLCWLYRINILDLSHNMLSGSIPPCFNNITMFGKIVDPMKFRQSSVSNDVEIFGYDVDVNLKGFDAPEMDTLVEFPKEGELVTKSRLESYKDDILTLMGGLDFSCNQLTGEIPLEIGALISIHALNFSHNQLIGSIPKTLSNMQQIESLDLSHNRLTGEIPSDLTAITTLEIFTVAYNDLSGRVPDWKEQFATFDETSYEGNPLLCGSPLPKQCDTNIEPPTVVTDSEQSDDEPWMDLMSFLSSFGASYIMCMLGITAALYINPYWRHIWFNFADTCLSFIFPFWSEAIYNTRNPLT